MERLRVLKSNKNARGTVACDNTTMHLLQANDFVAEAIRKEMKQRNILMINITSSAGSGKTTLMQETVKHLKNKVNMAVLVGDLETERDADRIKQVGGNLMLISKADLLPYVPFSIEAVTKDALEVNPKIEVLTISSTSGEGIDKWFEWLMERVEEKKMELLTM